MNEFYTSKIKPYAEKIKQYITSDEYRELFKGANGTYAYDRYYDYFIKHTIGGKCIRGYLVYLFNMVFGGEETADVTKTAAAFEVFESAVLMHDDIIDRGRIRRGIPSAYVALGDDRTGEARAICLGDIGLITSLTMLDDIQNSLVEAYMKRVFLRTISGELHDVDLSKQSVVTETEVIDAYMDKTANYTIIGPTMCAAILNDVKREYLNELVNFSAYAGIAFQIKDDLLGIYGDQTAIGKNGSSDIAEGKKTILLSHFDANATEEQKSKLYSIYGKEPVTDEGICAVKELFEATGSKAHAEKTMNEYFKIATMELDKLFDNINPDEQAKAEVYDFIAFLQNRIK